MGDGALSTWSWLPPTTFRGHAAFWLFVRLFRFRGCRHLFAAWQFALSVQQCFLIRIRQMPFELDRLWPAHHLPRVFPFILVGGYAHVSPISLVVPVTTSSNEHTRRFEPIVLGSNSTNYWNGTSGLLVELWSNSWFARNKASSWFACDLKHRHLSPILSLDRSCSCSCRFILRPFPFSSRSVFSPPLHTRSPHNRFEIRRKQLDAFRRRENPSIHSKQTPVTATSKPHTFFFLGSLLVFVFSYLLCFFRHFRSLHYLSLLSYRSFRIPFPLIALLLHLHLSFSSSSSWPSSSFQSPITRSTVILFSALLFTSINSKQSHSPLSLSSSLISFLSSLHFHSLFRLRTWSTSSTAFCLNRIHFALFKPAF